MIEGLRGVFFSKYHNSGDEITKNVYGTLRMTSQDDECKTEERTGFFLKGFRGSHECVCRSVRWKLEHNDDALEWELDSYHRMYDRALKRSLNGRVGAGSWELGAGTLGVEYYHTPLQIR